MKAFYISLALVFLVSCGEQAVVNTVNVNDQVTQEVVDEIEVELEQLVATESEADESLAAVESELIVLDARYNNPRGEVDMEVEYSLDEEGNIESINVTATKHDVTEFNTEIQSVIGGTLEEASSVYVAGSSLTSAAFNEALKNG